MSEQKKTKKAAKVVKTAEVTENAAPAEGASATQPAKANIGKIAKAAAEARKTLAQSDVFVFVKTPEKPVAPQANVIVEVIKQSGVDGISRPQLVESLKGVLTTRQPEERILTYYQSSLVDAGIIKIVNPGRDELAAKKAKETPPQEAPADGEAPAEGSAEETPA